jgi:hypothetical protein
MSATAARRFLTVDGPNLTAEVSLGDGPIEVVSLRSLKRPELLRAVKVALPTVPFRACQKASNEVILEAIRTGDTAPITDHLFDKHRTEDGTTQERPNKFPARCGQCQTHLSEGAGRIRKEGTKWVAYCVEHLPATSEPTIEWTDEVTIPQSTTPPPSQDGVTDALTTLITSVVKAELADVTPNLDEDRVRSIIAGELDKHPARRVEIVTNDGVRELPEVHHDLLPEIVTILGAGIENIFLVGPAGSGKSTLGEQAAEALGLEFRTVSFGPTTPTSKLFGYNDASGRYIRTPFRDAYEFGHVFIGDELDNGHPGLVAELNQALANGCAAFADGLVAKHKGFRFIATGNTFGRGPDRLFVGRNILDAATLDRFVTIECPVDERIERLIALAFATDASQAKVEKWVKTVQAARANIEAHNLPLVCSPRSAINGAKLLTAGLTEARVKEITLAKGWSLEHRQKAGV